jgi:hypothetical protein
MKISVNKYIQLLDDIGSTIEQARQNAVKTVNTELVKANWEIGRHIVEYGSMDRNEQSMEATC